MELEDGRNDADGAQLHDFRMPVELAGTRLDKALAELFPDYSRARIQGWLKAGQVQVDGSMPRSRDRVVGGEHVLLEATFPADISWTAEALPLEVVHEDDHLLVVDKPAGLVTHPGAGNHGGTLLNAILHHLPSSASLPRAGIVHRLDKETSGLLVVAKSQLAHQRLIAALAAREVSRQYLALARGEFTAGGTVDAPIGRHPRDRLRMAVRPGGKPARTHYRVEARFQGLALLRVNLESGRTHQIRVHLAHLRHPLVGDQLYGGRAARPAGLSPALQERVAAFPRQALHAARLALVHPASGESLAWESPLPDDFASLLAALRADAANTGNG